MYYVYILQSELTGRYYIGSTGNPEDRLLRHNSGRSQATKSGLPWRLVWQEEFSTREEACKREIEIKSWKSHSRIASMVSVSR
jgi:putative endonuclease